MELPTWLWIVLALAIGAVFGSISWRLKKKARRHMDLLDEMRGRQSPAQAGRDGRYHDDYHTTENVMERAVAAEDIPLDAIEN